MSKANIPNATVREATVADCLAVGIVQVRSWRESFAGIVHQTFLDSLSVADRAEAFENRFADASYKMYVAEVLEQGVIGFADFGEPREVIGAYESELYAIYLLPEYQRMGIGQRLFNNGVEFLLSRGKRSMYLLTLEASPFRSFYERMGGRVVAKKQVAIGGVMYDELVYGWENLR